jgi:hypothetical protein
MANPEFGKWSTFAHAAPASWHGRTIDRSGGWKLVLQAAPINSSNLSGATQPVWVDITDRLIDVAWGAGDAELESRLPAGQSAIRTVAFSDLVGTEPMTWATVPNDRFGTQCLIRLAIVDPAGAWRPLCLHVIDSIAETWEATSPRRVWEIDAYDPLYLIAGYRTNATYGTLGTDAESAFMAICTAIGFPFTRYWSTGTLASWLVGGEPAQPPLTLMHRVADTISAMVAPDNLGQLRMSAWDYFDDIDESTGTTRAYPITPYWTVVDGYSWVAAGAQYGFPTWSTTILPTALRMVNTIDRIAWSCQADTTEIVGASIFSTPYLSARYSNRVDRPGWPKNDLLYNNTASPIQRPDVQGAGFRASDPTRPDWISFDTQTAPGTQLGNQKDLDTLLRFMSRSTQLRRCYQFQRRNYGTDGWWTGKVMVGAHDNVITRTGNQFRWQSTHFLQTWQSA